MIYNGKWIHADECRKNHDEPTIEKRTSEAIPINEELAKIAENMLKTGEQVRDISQYAYLYTYLGLPRTILPKITIGILDEEEKFGFKYI
jgi:hypothetical protein